MSNGRQQLIEEKWWADNNNFHTCDGKKIQCKTLSIDGFMIPLIDVATNKNDSTILYVTTTNFAVMPGEFVFHYSAKNLFSIIIGVNKFRTSQL